MNCLPKGLTLIGLLAVTAFVPVVAAAPPASPGQADGGAEGQADGPADGQGAAIRVALSFNGHIPDGVAPQARFLGATVVAVDEALGLVVLESDDAAHASQVRAQAQERGDVRAVEADDLQRLVSFTPNDPEFAVSVYGPQHIGAPAAWDTTLGSAAVKLCVVDTGIRASHLEFAGRIVAGIDLVNSDNDPTDDNGHGTHVAGIAAAATNNGQGTSGIAQSSLLVAKVLDAAGNGYMSTVASGIRWCADNGAQVISMSLGSTSPATAVQDAVDYAWSKGALLAAASGNGACTGCVQYPAAYPNVIAVGCVDHNRAVCSFTSQGPEVDLAAPGYSIQSTWYSSDTSLMRATGTSMSTPHVAGAAALVLSAHPQYANAQVRQALESSAQDVAAAGKDVASGFGLVRADLALAANVSAVIAPPAPAPAPGPAPAPAPVHSASVTPAHQAKAVAAKGTVSYAFTLQNTGSEVDTFTVTKTTSRNGWGTALVGTSFTLEPGQTTQVVLTVTAPQKSPAMTVALTVSAAGAALASATAQTSIAK